MTHNDIQHLIDRYLEAETTPAEERQLALALQRDDIPDEWQAVRLMLGELTLGEALYDELLATQAPVPADPPAARPARRHLVPVWRWAVAAAVVVAAGLGIYFAQPGEPLESELGYVGPPLDEASSEAQAHFPTRGTTVSHPWDNGVSPVRQRSTTRGTHHQPLSQTTSATVTTAPAPADKPQSPTHNSLTRHATTAALAADSTAALLAQADEPRSADVPPEASATATQAAVTASQAAVTAAPGASASATATVPEASASGSIDFVLMARQMQDIRRRGEQLQQMVYGMIEREPKPANY